MRSMTGFGRATHEDPSGSVTCEIRSVNHRSLKVSLRVPGSLAGREAALESRVRGSVERGSVQGRLRVERATGEGAPLVDADLARRYAEALADLHVELGLEGDPDLAMIVGLPGVVLTGPVDDETPAELLAAADAALDAALAELVQHREDEGAALAEDFESRLGAVEGGLATVRDRAGTQVEALRDRLTKRLEDLVPDLPAPEVRDTVAREIVMAAEKADVSEEITRLETHVGAFRETMAADGAVGRRLDFLLQEMLREVNTIGSKSQDAAIAAAVVDMKVAVDRLKEQAANVE